MKDSKGVADIIVNACSCENPSPDFLRTLIENSQIFEESKENPNYETEIKDATNQLQFIVDSLPKNLINVFRLDSEEGSQDIELTILTAFLNCKLFLDFILQASIIR